MIDKIKGTVDNFFTDSVSIEVNNIYYRVYIPSGLIEKLKLQVKQNPEIILYTHYYIEGGVGTTSMTPRLIGFLKPTDREFFDKYTQVKGLGIKTALKSITVSIKKIATAIENTDVAFLKKLPGLGKRTAEKIIAELRGKMAKYALTKELLPETSTDTVTESETDSSIETEALEILTQLGYSKKESQTMIQKALKINQSYNTTEELIQELFKQAV